MQLTYKEAGRIMDAIIEELHKNNKSAVIAVADSYGELLAFVRMDKVKLHSINISQNKAWTAARAQKSTMEIGKGIRDAEKGYDISYYGDPKYTAFGGGVPVRYQNTVIGGIGVSGLSQEEDEAYALLGAKVIEG